ncbi:MAG: IS701 family transposase [Gammaproteobacteria bacterium]|nr:IS701 family transposase [Gammaproteobacteria bacterium]
MSFNYELTIADIQAQAEALVEFHSQYTAFFQTKTRDNASQALEYLKGQLLLKSKRNMSQMATEVTAINEQALSHFTSNAPWDDASLTVQIGQDAVALIGPGGALLLDESGNPKQGDKSVGVARQYCGRLGKVDNCQVGVFVAYAKAGQTTLIDKRLYLPQEWTDDPERCRQAGVPEAEMVFRKKSELGLEMILQARKNQIPFKFVNMDAHYGQQAWLLSRLEAENIEYMAEIPADTRVYLAYPAVGIPERNGKRGRKPSKTRVLDGQPIEVRALLEMGQLRWTVLKVRDTARGELWIRFAALRVYRLEDELPVEHPIWLCLRQELGSGDVKFAFSNAPVNSPIKILADKMCTRYWVERAIEDAKGLAGLDEYQVIGWRGWHHHMTMTMLAMLFLVTLRKNLVAQAPMLTLQDAKQILEILLPKKSLTLEDAVKIIEKKHWNRYCSRNSRLKKQRKQLQMHHFH